MSQHLAPTSKAPLPNPPGVRFRRNQQTPKRTAPYDVEPGFWEPGQLWLYGNFRLLDAKLAVVEATLGQPDHTPKELEAIEQEAERIVLDGKILVCGVHSPAHQRAAVVPLRYGAPRILIFSGGFYHHLGENLREEPFRIARLWRYEWDAKTDLAISRRAPGRLPTYCRFNPSVDRLIQLLVRKEWPGLRDPSELLRSPVLGASSDV